MPKKRLSPLKWFAKNYKGDELGDYNISTLMDGYADYCLSLEPKVIQLKQKTRLLEKELHLNATALMACYEYDNCSPIIKDMMNKVDKLYKRK